MALGFLGFSLFLVADWRRRLSFPYNRSDVHACSAVGNLLLGSPWALIPGLASGALYVVRTYLEDKTLRQELPGYEEYTQRTRYRLLPGIW